MKNSVNDLKRSGNYKTNSIIIFSLSFNIEEAPDNFRLELTGLQSGKERKIYSVL
jgi:hypothetical protein